MEKIIKLIKAILMMITIFIVIQGVLMLTVYGFSIWFFMIVMAEVVLLISQIFLMRMSTYRKWYDVVYLLPFPLIYIVTLFG